MKPWYRKKKVWATILGALVVVLTIFFSPERIEAVERISLAVLEAAITIGFVFTEAGIDKAAIGLADTMPPLTVGARMDGSDAKIVQGKSCGGCTDHHTNGGFCRVDSVLPALAECFREHNNLVGG